MPGPSSSCVLAAAVLLVAASTLVTAGGRSDDDVLRGPGDSTPESAWSSVVSEVRALLTATQHHTHITTRSSLLFDNINKIVSQVYNQA